MRTLIVRMEDPPLKPWVVYETPVEPEEAIDQVNWSNVVALTRAEAMVSYREAVEAWDRGDDATYGVVESMGED